MIDTDRPQPSPPSSPAADRYGHVPAYRWYALSVLLLVYISSNVDRQIVGILLEPIKRELGASDTQMGFLIGLTFALFYAILGIPIAMVADRSNRRNIIVAAISLWSAMTMICGLAGNFLQLALARVGVGVGEAGSSPPSHSMISDMFPIRQRGTAMGIFALGTNLGSLVAYLAGGWMSQHWGWRATFIAVGLPGLLIALLVRLTVSEPIRGASERMAIRVRKGIPFRDVARTMWRTRAARHIVAGGSLSTFVGYGMVLWLPAFFVRSHGLSQSEVGMTLALMTGIVGGAGTFLAGRFADLLSRHDRRWLAWVVAAGQGGLVPFLIAFFLIRDLVPALFMYLVPALLMSSYLAPTFAMIQNLVEPGMRSVAAAVFLFLINIIGLGLGPQGVGMLSDYLAATYGQESLRYSLMAFSVLNLWSAVHYLLASRSLAEDIDRATAAPD